ARRLRRRHRPRSPFARRDGMLRLRAGPVAPEREGAAAGRVRSAHRGRCSDDRRRSGAQDAGPVRRGVTLTSAIHGRQAYVPGKVVVRSFGVSLDGFAAGPRQSLDNPLGERGPELMAWFFPTRVWQQMHGNEGGETGVDNRMAELGFANMGA